MFVAAVDMRSGPERAVKLLWLRGGYVAGARAGLANREKLTLVGDE